jgi:hypothetical protein
MDEMAHIGRMIAAFQREMANAPQDLDPTQQGMYALSRLLAQGEHRPRGAGNPLGVVECRECFALVQADRLTAHEAWHDQQVEQWRRDHLGEE